MFASKREDDYVLEVDISSLREDDAIDVVLEVRAGQGNPYAELLPRHFRYLGPAAAEHQIQAVTFHSAEFYFWIERVHGIDRMIPWRIRHRDQGYMGTVVDAAGVAIPWRPS